MTIVRRINIPISFIQRLKDDKTSIEMLVCAIMIKHKYQHSVLYNVNKKRIAQFFGVCHRKAARLYDAFMTSDLFIYNKEKKSLYAKSFKSKERVILGRKGVNRYEAFADYCYKMQMTDDIELKKVVTELRNILAMNVIDTVERYGVDNLKSQTGNVTKPAGRNALPQRLLAKCMGVSRATAARYLKRMEETGRVSKTQIVAECVIPVLNETTVKAFREVYPNRKFYVWHDIVHGGWSGWVMYGYAYSIRSRKDSDAFRHVIWNYDPRRRKGADCQQPKTSAELDGKFKN